MSEWKRVCCAVDFSEPSRLALEEAVDLCRRSGAELTIVHVRTPPPPTAVALLASPGEAARAVAEEVELAIAAWGVSAEGKLERPVATAVLVGSAAGEIVRYARRHPIDLLVVATQGRTGLGRLLLGSVAERVVREAPCPVLVVRRREGSLEEDAEEAAMYGTA